VLYGKLPFVACFLFYFLFGFDPESLLPHFCCLFILSAACSFFVFKISLFFFTLFVVAVLWYFVICSAFGLSKN